MKKTTQTISIFSWKRIILKGFTNKCNVGTEYLISEFVVNELSVLTDEWGQESQLGRSVWR